MPPPTPSSASPPRGSLPPVRCSPNLRQWRRRLPRPRRRLCRRRATLSVVLNALRINPGRRWKGPWRWFDESMLDCCEHLDKVRSHGITFGKVACLVHCAGADVRRSAGQVTVDDLRRHLVRCASSLDYHLIVSYHRKLGGWSTSLSPLHPHPNTNSIVDVS
ncbi:hypothetical protein GUJ93_ZPchr0012g20205 [Zizania palustris]|uniref:Peptidase C83 domain-containing protein n=1 Tax=Zizania palustris TaxID=103762 RepID=A0A8J5WLW2_ZIZPA|nr:hypothetical protein GUJ93_ZPchr0012g20205 [Zizania palustris]